MNITFVIDFELGCIPLSETKGRCGPQFGGRCNKNLADWAVYCNTANGWCGTTCRHRYAQDGDEYDWSSNKCEGEGNQGQEGEDDGKESKSNV